MSNPLNQLLFRKRIKSARTIRTNIKIDSDKDSFKGLDKSIYYNKSS